MSTIRNEIINLLGDSERYPDNNEPIFILRAQDVSAPDAVRAWVDLNPDLALQKRAEAYRLIADMLDWQNKNLSKVKNPD